MVPPVFPVRIRMKATKGIVVTLQYTLSSTDGEVLETSVGDEPLEYLHGYGEIVPGLEKVIEGADVGFKTKVTVPAAEGYGERDEDAIFDVPRDELPEDIQEGEEIYADDEDEEGEADAFTVLKVTDESVTLDGNHPFAGKDLVFDVEVIGLRAASDEELEHGHAHGEDEDEACD